MQLRQQVSHMGLHRLFREEEAVADLPVYEALGDQLEDFELPGGRLLLELLEGSRKRDDFSGATGRSPLRNCFEAPGVVHVATEDVFSLSSVHSSRIGGPRRGLTPPF